LDYIKRNKGVKQLPLVVSIIYYMNKKPFSYSRDINDYFENKELAKKYAFTTQFVDLVRQGDEEILQHNYIKGLEIILKYAAKRDIDSVLALASKEITGYDSFARQTLIKYMSDYSNLDFEEFYDKIVGSNIDLQGDVMTVSQQIEARALQKHAPMLKAEGKAEGAHEKALATARNFLMMGIEAEKVAQGTGLSPEEINGIAEEVKASRH
jgi:predicted transposase YdaD